MSLSLHVGAGQDLHIVNPFITNSLLCSGFFFCLPLSLSHSFCLSRSLFVILFKNSDLSVIGLGLGDALKNDIITI